MSTQQIVERIRSDALNEAEKILSEAEIKAKNILSEAEERIAALDAEEKTNAEERRKSILDKKAAAARLESAKILLKEKRKVIDTVYDEALSRLLELNEEDSLKLVEKLLKAYAEKGDEVFFAESFRYVEKAALLPVVEEKGLKFSKERLPLLGGLFLKGEKADKDLSYATLLKADREEHQAELAQALFR